MAKKVKEPKAQFIYWIKFVTYQGNTNSKFVKEDHPAKGISIDLMQWLENNMQLIMDKNDWITVIDYKVITTGFDLKIKDHIVKKPRTFKPPVVIEKEVEKIVTKTVILPTLDYPKLAISGRPSNKNAVCTHMPLEIKNYNEISEEIRSVLGGKKILFLENDGILSYSVGNFYRWTLENNIDSFCLFHIRHLPKEFVASKIIEYDVIAYQTTYTYEETRNLVKFVIELPFPKTIIECARESHFSKQTAPQHRIFALNCLDDDGHFSWQLNEEL